MAEWTLTRGRSGIAFLCLFSSKPPLVPAGKNNFIYCEGVAIPLNEAKGRLDFSCSEWVELGALGSKKETPKPSQADDAVGGWEREAAKELP